MKLIVGLGNPGRVYANSRHNIGFLVARALAKKCKAALTKDTHAFSLSTKIKCQGRSVILATPLTFMNLSGQAVAALLERHRLDPEGLLVICDDLDLEFGRLRLRSRGSSGGHRGLASIIGAVGSDGFCRLRIGIGRPGFGRDAADYVLSPFTTQEIRALPGIIDTALECCVSWAVKGAQESMGIFNKNASVADEARQRSAG